MYSAYETFHHEKISIAYFGVFNDDITNLLIDLNNDYLNRKTEFSKTTKKTSFLIAESFQNIIRHRIIERDKITDIQYNKEFYQISIFNEGVQINSANVINRNVVFELNDSIEHINTLSQEELKKLKLQLLEHGKVSNKGGAGLGLIEIVRKTKLPLQKMFFPLTNDFSLLLLGIMFPFEKKQNSNPIKIEKVGQFYRNLVENGTLLLYKGDFSDASNSVIIDILHKNFMKEGRFDSNKVKNIVTIIEVLQNVSKHGKVIDGLKEGIFSVKELNGDIYIECSNFVKEEDYLPLKNLLKKIKSASLQEINELYKKTMTESIFSNDENAGLGFLEIARFTQNKFSYYFIENSDQSIFFSIRIKTI